MAKQDDEMTNDEQEINLLEKLFDEDNDDNIVLFDDDGNEIELEQMAAVNYDGKVYAVLHVVGDPEDEVVVFSINPEDEDSVVMVDDEDLGNKILEMVLQEMDAQ